MEALPSTLESAILSVFSGGQGAAQSNEYLLEFVETEAAWRESLALFESSNEIVRYFAANIIYTKSRRHWSQINDEQKDGLMRVLLGVLDRIGPHNQDSELLLTTQRSFLNRIILSLACVCSRIPKTGIQLFVQQALAKIRPSSPPSLNLLGLEMLAILPTEVEDLDVARLCQEDLKSQLAQSSEAVLKSIDVLADHSSTASENQLRLGSLKVLRSWLLVAITSLSALQESHQPCMKFVYSSLLSGNEECIREACGFIRAIIQLEGYPPSSRRGEIVHGIIDVVISSVPSIVPLFDQESGGDAVAHDVCDCLVSLATQDLQIVANPRTCKTNLFDLLLMFAAMKPRKVAAKTFDVWLALQELPVAERHVYLTQEVFYKLLNILLDQCAAPLSWEVGNGALDDVEDFALYRDTRMGSIDDVVLVCFYSLQHIFFSALGDRLNVCVSGTLETIWPVLESVLFILHLSMDAIKSSLGSENSGAALQFLHNTLQLVLQKLPLPGAHELQCTACKFIGSLTFLLATDQDKIDSSPFRALFVPSLEFVFQSLQSPEACKAAAKAVYQLCIHGQRLINTSFDGGASPITVDNMEMLLITKIVRATNALMLQPLIVLEDTTFGSVIEGVVRSVVLLPSPLARALIGEMGRPIIEGLKQEFQASQTNVVKMGSLLFYASQIVRFCDVDGTGAGSDPSTHLLFHFLSEIWPLLQTLENHPDIHKVGTLSVRLFDLYGRVVMSAIDIILVEIPRILQSVVSVFRTRGEGSTSSLQCARNIVEILSNREAPQMRLILTQLLEYISQVLFSHIQEGTTQQSFANGSLWGYDPECFESYFALILTFFTSCPDVLASSPALHQVLEIGLATLNASKERGTVRSVLQIMQLVFVGSPHHQKMAACRRVFFAAACRVGPQLTKIMMECVSGSVDSTLRHNVIDMLLSILISSDSDSSVSQMWVREALVDPKVLQPVVTSELRAFVIQTMFMLSATNQRRFKAFLSDLCKVAASELPVDTLGAFA
jgi:hypothetical protein